MKTRCMKLDWLVPLVGIAVVAAAVAAAKAYLDFERETHTGEVLTATLDRLSQGHQLSLALKSIHDGDAAAAARRLDLLLCEHIVRIDSELPSADARARPFVEDSFRRMALVRPRIAEGGPADSAKDFSDDQFAAEQILSRALAGAHTALVH